MFGISVIEPYQELDYYDGYFISFMDIMVE